MADLHDLVAAYALNALGDEEHLVFEQHLAECADCQTELSALQPAIVGLTDDVAVEPPEAMRATVLEAIESTAQLEATAVTDNPPIPATTVDLSEHRRRRTWQWATGIATAAILAVVVGVSTLGGGLAAEDITAAPDVAAISLQGDIGDAQFLYSDSLDGGIFISTSLPAVNATETYQLWLIDASEPNPAGTFRPADDGSVEFIVEAPIAPGQTLGMTIEPAGGSPAPTGEILLAEQLD